MISCIAYGAGVLLGALIPIGSTRWAALFIVSVLFDDLRYKEVSVTNVVLFAFLASLTLEFLFGRQLRSPLILIPSLGLLLIALVSAALAAEPLKSVRFVGSLAMLGAASLGLACVASSSRQLQTLISAVLWMSGLLAVTILSESALWVFFGIHFKDTVYYLVNLDRYVFQASGFFRSNALAAFHLIPGIALAGSLRSRLSRGPARTRLNWYVLLTVSALVATVARAALVSLVAFAVVLLVRRAARPGWARLFAILVLVLLVAVIPQFVRFIAGFNINSFVARYGIARGAFDAIAQHPFVGSGPGSKAVPRYASWTFEVAPLFEDDDSVARDTHNTALQIPVELGLVGLLCFIAVNAVLFGSAFSTLRRLRDPQLSSMLQSLVIALLLTEFFSLFDSVFYTKPIWVLFGLVGGATRIASAHLTPLRIPRARLVPVSAALTTEISR